MNKYEAKNWIHEMCVTHSCVLKLIVINEITDVIGELHEALEDSRKDCWKLKDKIESAEKLIQNYEQALDELAGFRKNDN